MTSRRAVLSPRVPSPLHTCHGLCIYSGQILTQQGRKASRACRGRGHWEPPRVAPEPLLMGLIRASSPGNSLHKEQRGREGKRCSLNLPWNNTSCRFPPTCLSLFAAPGLAEWRGSRGQGSCGVLLGMGKEGMARGRQRQGRAEEEGREGENVHILV